jgi:nucleotide-binding universal stress UspA family protein/predicted phosphoribosyltransferase
MQAIQHVLVATDFSPASDRALDTAAEVAMRFGSKLTILHVSAPIPFEPTVPPETNLQPALRSLLAKTVASVKATYPSAEAVVREGDPDREIVRAAEELGADLLVLGTHARKGLAHAMLGSVAEYVVRASHVPVLTVHGFWFADRSDAGEALAAAVRGKELHAPVVVALSRGAVLVASTMAERLDAPLELLITEPLVRGGAAFGAMCEAGQLRLDPDVPVGVEEREMLVKMTRALVDDESDQLRRGPWDPDLWRRTVILVTDALTDEWTALVAADAVAQRGPENILVAAPVASGDALAAVRREFPNTVVLHELTPRQDAGAAYRDFAKPSTRTVLARLRGTTARVA